MKVKNFPDYSFENEYLSKYNIIAGLDEAGRGPLAGPVVAAAVILKPYSLLNIGINDSKQMNHKKREELAEIIKSEALSYSIQYIEPDIIDTINILQATQRAFKRCVESLRIKPDFLLVDGNYYSNQGFDYKCIVKGDSKSISIAAASILAKTERDKYMLNIADRDFPQYDFKKHKGYATKVHFEKIRQFGISPIHRKSFLVKFTERENSLFY